MLVQAVKRRKKTKKLKKRPDRRPARLHARREERTLARRWDENMRFVPADSWWKLDGGTSTVDGRQWKVDADGNRKRPCNRNCVCITVSDCKCM